MEDALIRLMTALMTIVLLGAAAAWAMGAL